MAKIFVQTGWHGGIADDRSSGIARSFQSGKGVEIRKNPLSLKLANSSEKDSASVITDLPLAFVTIQTTGDIIAFGDTGKIYRNATGAGTWVLVYTDTGNAKILNAYEYNGYLYWATATNLHRILITNIDASWAGTVTEDYKIFNTGNAHAHPMIEIYNKLYIGDGSDLAELDNFGVFTSQKITIFGDEEIVALTFSGAMMRIYARRTTKVDYGRAYLWDGVQLVYNEFVAWDGLTIHAAINKDGLDYVIAGKRPAIYRSTGYQRNLLKRIPNVTTSLLMNPNAADVYDDTVAIGLASGGDAVKRGVWTWGNLTASYPDSLNFDFPTSNDNTTDTIGAIHQSDGVLYQSWKNGANYGVDKIDLTKYATTGEIVSRIFKGDAGFVRKNISKLDISFAPLAAGEKIELYARKNLELSWGSAIATVDYAVATDQGVSSKRITDVFADQEFDFIEFKIVLTAGTSQLTTPEVFEIAATYEIIKE